MKQTLWKNRQGLAVGFIALLYVLLLSGCADTVSFTRAEQVIPVGFWYGLWHGMIAPFAWLVSLFDESVAIYAIYNNGGWYDFGYMMGIGALSSSGTASVKR